MNVISIVAPGNGSGKTRAACSLLSAFEGRLAAVKFTTVYRDGANCPRAERACACRSLHGRFTVITDPTVLGQEGTDTHRMARSGARSVAWCLVAEGAHREVWAHLQSGLVRPDANLLTEGNSIVGVVNPDRVIMILSPVVEETRWKTGTWDLIRRADYVYVNTHGASVSGIESLAARVSMARGGDRPKSVDVASPLSRWPGPSLRDDIAGVLDRQVESTA